MASPNALAIEQIKRLVDKEPLRDLTPLFVFDAGYDPVQLSQGLEGGEDSLPAGCVERFQRS